VREAQARSASPFGAAGQNNSTGQGRFGIPPTAVGGLFKLSLPKERRARCHNPTHGSGWIVQAQPTQGAQGPLPNPTYV